MIDARIHAVKHDPSLCIQEGKCNRPQGGQYATEFSKAFRQGRDEKDGPGIPQLQEVESLMR